MPIQTDPPTALTRLAVCAYRLRLIAWAAHFVGMGIKQCRLKPFRRHCSFMLLSVLRHFGCNHSPTGIIKPLFCNKESVVGFMPIQKITLLRCLVLPYDSGMQNKVIQGSKPQTVQQYGKAQQRLSTFLCISLYLHCRRLPPCKLTFLNGYPTCFGNKNTQARIVK